MYNTFTYDTVPYNSTIVQGIARLIVTRPIFLGQNPSNANLTTNANEPTVLGNNSSTIILG